MQRLLDTQDENDFAIELDTDFELGYVVNEETFDVTKWPTFTSSIYLVKYNPIQVYSDGTPTYNYGNFSGATTYVATLTMTAFSALFMASV